MRYILSEDACPWCHGATYGLAPEPFDLAESMVPAYAPPPGVLADERPPIYEARGFGYPPADPARNLKRRMWVYEVEQMARQDRNRSEQYADFLAMMRPGDEVWYYDSMGEVPLSGHSAMLLLRSGNVIAQIIYMVS